MAPALAAREQLTLKVRALPARDYQVLFVLPTTSGDPLDAALDRASAQTDENGVATVVLTAPSSPTTFDVRASVGETSASVTLTVTDRGLATLQVVPSYPSLLRDITTWVATAHVGKSCAEVPGIPPPDGELKAPLAGKEEAPVISRVPAGTRLAVTLRSGHFAGGCTTVDQLPPGPPESPQIVEVTVLNRPIDLGSSSLSVSLGLEPTDKAWSDALAAAGVELQAAMLGSSADDAEALLDAMRNASGDSAQAFQDASDLEDWPALVRSRWGQNSASRLRDRVGGWLNAGRQSFVTAASPFAGSLTPLRQPKEVDAPSSALLTLRTVAGLDAARAGFVDAAQTTWSASADDTLVLSTDIYFARTKLIAALAEAAALARAESEGVELESGAAALAAALDCDALGATLAGAGVDTTLAYATCDAACLTETCERAARLLWTRGAESSGVDYTRLSLTATGGANVGDEAEVTGFAGTWLGELRDDRGKASTSGVIAASAIAPNP